MATVYDKSSLFLAPSGVSNGTVFVQKPVPIYGSEQVANGDFSQTGAELITNGDFATDSDWEKSSFWTISGGTASMPSTSSYLPLYQNDVTIAGKTYVLNFDIVSITGIIKATSINNGAAAGEITLGEYSTTGNKKVYFTAGSGREAIAFARVVGVSASCSIDNVSVKEVGQDWALGTGWSIGEDKAICDGTNQAVISQNQNLVAGNTYKLTFEIIDYVSGILQAYLPFGLANLGSFSANGIYTLYASITSTPQNNIYFRGLNGNSFNGSITNISVQEVLSPDGDFTFTRGSNLSATRVNEDQLIEKGRENLLPQSNDFSQWSAGAHTRTFGYSGYDGTNDAWLVEKTSTTNSYIFSPTISVSGVWTYSVYAKADTLGGLVFYTTASGSATFNIEDGLVVSGSNTSIESVGNGWYRCSQFGVGSITQTRLKATDKTGVDVQGTIYLQDAQLEQGLVATSVITTGAVPAQAGLLENTPRLDYSGGASCPSLLLEPQRSNLLAYSEYYAGGQWANTDVNLTTNYALSPEGEMNASLWEFTTTNILARIQYVLGGITAGATYTQSYYIKSLSGDLTLRIGTSGAIGGEFKDITATSEWQRFDFTSVASDTTEYPRIQNISGTQGAQILVYGAQMELGSYPTSYIPTYGTSQTRAGELYENKNINNFINTANGFSFYYEISNFSQTDSSFSDYFSFKASDSNSPNIRCELRTDGSAGIFATGITGWNTINLSNWTTSGETTQKLLIVITNNSQKAYLNGVEGLDSSAASIVLPTFQQLVTENFFGQTALMKFSVNQAILFPTALSDLDAKILTGATTYETFDEMALALNYTVYE